MSLHKWLDNFMNARLIRPIYATAVICLLICSASVSVAVLPTTPICIFGDVRFDTDFSGARLNHCIKSGKYEYSLATVPESQPINPSPWYAFKVSSARNKKITVYLHYSIAKHRYSPKISMDNQTWVPLEDNAYQVILNGKAIKMTLAVGPKPLFVSAQEIIDNQDYDKWVADLDTLPYVDSSIIGYSVQKRPITQLVTQGDSEQWVLIIGRQHPPEIPGSIALRHFVEVLLADTKLAKDFRRQFRLMMVPNLNPDGVMHGNWRLNMNAVDLNRDWGIFSQPETMAVAEQLAKIIGVNGQRLLLGLDFHATDQDIFYTQQDGSVKYLSHFTDTWLKRIQDQVPQFMVRSKAPLNGGNPGVFKNYLNATYGIPAITYELGDDTDREIISIVADVSAKEMMRILLASNGHD